MHNLRKKVALEKSLDTTVLDNKLVIFVLNYVINHFKT